MPAKWRDLPLRLVCPILLLSHQGLRRRRRRLKKQVPRPLCIQFMFKAPNPETRTEESGNGGRLMPTVRRRRALFEYASAGVKPSVPEIGPVLAHQRRQIILPHEFWIHVLQLF